VLTNILLNARDAVADGGNIWITSEENGPNVIMKIKDDGKGIAPDIIGRIFEPLVTTKRGQGGTGLGLAITRRILHASGGDVTVESTPGHGAEFTITLPKRGSGSVDQSVSRSESENDAVLDKSTDLLIH
jgi:signal transduction histidine kinase